MVMDQLTTIFRDVFQDEELNIAEDMTAADIDDWDSVMHINLILTVEEHFGVRFKSSEVARLQSIGELHNLVVEKSADQ